MPEGDGSDRRRHRSGLGPDSSSTTRKESDDEFQSWNRWRDDEGGASEDPRLDSAGDDEAELDLRDAAQDPAEPESPRDSGYDSRSGDNSPRRRGGGRHRVKKKGWAKAPKRVGPRRAARKQRRKESAKKLSKRGVVIAVALGATALLTFYVLSQLGDDREAGSPPATDRSGADTVTTTLLAGSRARGEEAVWLALLSTDASTGEGSVTYIPAHTAVEVPGRGLQGVGRALENGDTELLMLSARILLNTDIDHYLELAPEDAAALFASIGPLTVDVPVEVRVPAGAGTARLLFTEGVQELSAQRIVELLYTVGLDGDDVELGPRHLAFWDALFDSFADDPTGLAAAIAQAGDVGRSDARFSAHAGLLEDLAGAGPDGLTLSVLPVEAVAAGDSELYSVDREEVARYLEDVVHTPPAGDDEIGVQILNGNGVPGIGQEVAGRLVGQGFEIVLTGNYRSLDQGRTLIVTYDSSPEGIEAANQARELIGVGEVQVSAQEQGIVDLTIVVGKDFLRTQ